MKNIASRSSCRNSSIVVAALSCLTSSAAAGDCAPYWSALGSGVSENVHALAVCNDGRGPALYAGGFFITAGESAAFRVARWDGHAWAPLGRGLNGPVDVLASFDDGSGAKLYAGGQFTMPIGGPRQASRLAVWDGRAWTTVGGGLAGCDPFPLSSPCLIRQTVAALLVYDDDGAGPHASRLHVGGNFLTAGGVTVNHIASWDGRQWQALGTGMGSEVYALAAFDDGSGTALYASGEFYTAGGVAVDDVARWNGATWSAVGDPPLSDIRTLVVHDDGTGPALYAAGESGGSAGRVARWNASTWTVVGADFNEPVADLATFDDGSGSGAALYAAGDFTTVGSVSVQHIARWDGAAWSAMSGFDNQVSVLAALDDGSGAALYAGGQFTEAAGINANRIAKLRCPGASDINGDGFVNGVDLALLLAAWGPCPAGGACAADLDGSGIVNGVDLAIMLGQWG